MQELDAYRRTIQLHIHIEQMRLNAESLIPECRIVPYVCHPWVEAFFPLHTHSIHALPWHNGIDRADIGRGEPQLPTAPKALHDGAFDGIIAPQKTRRLFNAELALVDDVGAVRPFLASELPQLNSDTWRVFPDGRMETIYRLKDGITWHDGEPITADDFVFGWRVMAAPGLGRSGLIPQKLMEEIVAPDARTGFRMTLIRMLAFRPEAAGQQPVPAARAAPVAAASPAPSVAAEAPAVAQAQSSSTPASNPPVVAAVSAPSSLAAEFARESGQTLIGFLRGIKNTKTPMFLFVIGAVIFLFFDS
jgi:hypothetical protein